MEVQEMKLAIMQPYFLPYIGYFQLINAVDKFVIYDDVNYIKQGWINRNRILLDGEPFMFIIQLTGASSFKKINEIQIGKTRNKVLKTIQQAYSKAPYYRQCIDLLHKIFNYKTENISEFITNSIVEICYFLNIQTQILLSSQIGKDNLLKGEDKIIQICKLLQADTYINSIGGRNLYLSDNFRKEGIQLLLLHTIGIRYKQFSSDFVGNLSIIDILMFNSFNEVQEMLFHYDLISNIDSY